MQTPTGAIWYVPQARRHGDFLVQRRYVGDGNRTYSGGSKEGLLYSYRERATPLLVPYLNPDAVQAAGLDMTAIMNWNAAHPEQIFSHPTYAPLCLRWEANTHGYTVTAPQQSTLQPDEVPFIPYTCWLTGTTYYQVDTAADQQIITALRARAGLLLHEREVGLEGTWPGWYVIDIGLAGEVLAEIGQRVAVSCNQLYYGVWIYPEEPGVMHWLSLHPIAEEALAVFQCLPESNWQVQKSITMTAMWGYGLGWPGREPVWNQLNEKCIPFEYGIALWQNKAVPYPSPVAPRQLLAYEVAEMEVPLTERIPTLREIINAARPSRWQLTQGLGWTLAKLLHLEYHPWELTLMEVKQLARKLEVEEKELTTSLWHELQAWESEAKRERNTAANKALAAVKETSSVD
ncbi:hypothetical protein [Hymenobacter cheonanensis]|uniref:hypothetical protein n=1 Tax=Hymenobacter sp. CA2-7 TaxID=3063993 RepID=UPI00271338C9|nr:hypothetical protein [Hymenobacter sp. CA2-7]MDO7884239.1 hypothetical protein [Hymenobacter sp. CA2-7]